MARTKGSIAKSRHISAGDLRGILKPIFDKLKKAGVREEVWPSNDVLVAMLLKFIDENKVDAWVKQYASTMK